MKENRLLVVMPAFNEEDCISDVIAEVKASLPSSIVLVVDDGSRDKTAYLAKSAGALVATLPFNLGVGGAMRLGFKYAFEHHFDVVVQIDSDGQHIPSEVPKLITKLNENDLVIGARFAGQGEYKVSGPRGIAMRFLASTLSKIVGSKLTDSTSGFRASGRKAITLFSENYPAEYLGDTIESLVIANKFGLKISQVPVAMRSRAGGEPSNGVIKASSHLFRALLAICFTLIRPKANFINKEGYADS